MNINVNEINLSCVLEWKSELVTLQNKDFAINVRVSAKFGQRICAFDCTAYQCTAQRLSGMACGDLLVLQGALYQDIVKQPDGKCRPWTKIRINSIKTIVVEGPSVCEGACWNY